MVETNASVLLGVLGVLSATDSGESDLADSSCPVPELVSTSVPVVFDRVRGCILPAAVLAAAIARRVAELGLHFKGGRVTLVPLALRIMTVPSAFLTFLSVLCHCNFCGMEETDGRLTLMVPPATFFLPVLTSFSFSLTGAIALSQTIQ